jgi:hypothetical protein
MKQTSGIQRFVRQSISFSIVIAIFITFYNLSKAYAIKRLVFTIRKLFFYSFIAVSIYGFFEILVIVFHIRSLERVFTIFNYLPFVEVYLDVKGGRISSITHEPPFLAIYLITIAGWMFSYMLTSKKIIRFIPTIAVFILTFFSGSRTALLVVSFQFILFIFLIYSIEKKYKIRIRNFLYSVVFILSITLLFQGKKILPQIATKIESLNFQKNLMTNVSNRSRFGIQYASLIIFYENPLIGVGFGQQAYHAKDKYPKWATENNYEFTLYYRNDSDTSFPPGYNMYTRLLAETGSIGFFIFVSFLLLILYQCKKLIHKGKKNKNIFPVVLFVSFVGFSINWLQFDSFRVYGFWICLGILLRILEELKFSLDE